LRAADAILVAQRPADVLTCTRASEPSTFAEFVFYLAFGIVLLIIGAIYAAPTLLAFRRNHPNRWIILVINVAFGGTVIGCETDIRCWWPFVGFAYR
jgi:hypothetical protein